MRSISYPQITPLPLPSMVLPIHYSVITLLIRHYIFSATDSFVRSYMQREIGKDMVYFLGDNEGEKKNRKPSIRVGSLLA